MARIFKKTFSVLILKRVYITTVVTQKRKDFLFLSSDVNECQQQKCSNGGTCVNTQGSFYCKCKSGYSGKYCEKGGRLTCDWYITEYCINHQRPCLITFSKHREESWNYDAQRCIFDEIRGLEMWPNTVRLSDVDVMLERAMSVSVHFVDQGKQVVFFFSSRIF